MIFLANDYDLVFHKNIQVIYFYDPEYPFHEVAYELLKKLENKYVADFFGIDISFFTQMTKRFEIECFPTILFIKDGKEKKRLLELISFDKMSKIMEKMHDRENRESGKNGEDGEDQE